MFIHTCVALCASACIEARGGGSQEYSLPALCLIPLRQGLSLNLELDIFHLDWQLASPRDPIVSAQSSTGDADVFVTMPSFVHGC